MATATSTELGVLSQTLISKYTLAMPFILLLMLHMCTNSRSPEEVEAGGGRAGEGEEGRGGKGSGQAYWRGK